MESDSSSDKEDKDKEKPKKRSFPRLSALSLSALAPRWSMTNMKRMVTRVIPVEIDKRSWMAKYCYVAYAIFLADLITVIVYLSYISTQFVQPVMYLHYVRTDAWLKLNSYSLLSPFAAIPIVCSLAYHVRHNKKLVDGDFFGIQAATALLAALSIHDGTILRETSQEMMSMTSSKNLADLRSMYNSVYEEIRIIRGRRSINNYINYSEIPDWIQEFQRDNDCCGVNGYKDWVEFKKKKNFTEIPWSCCCERNKKHDCNEKQKSHCNVGENMIAIKKHGCAKAIRDEVIRSYQGASLCMFVLASFHFLVIIAYTVHWLIMRKVQPEHVFVDVQLEPPTPTYGEQRTRKRVSNQQTPTITSSASSLGHEHHHRLMPEMSLADLDPIQIQEELPKQGWFTTMWSSSPQMNTVPRKSIPSPV